MSMHRTRVPEMHVLGELQEVESEILILRQVVSMAVSDVFLSNSIH